MSWQCVLGAQPCEPQYTVYAALGAMAAFIIVVIIYLYKDPEQVVMFTQQEVQPAPATNEDSDPPMKSESRLAEELAEELYKKLSRKARARFNYLEANRPSGATISETAEVSVEIDYPINTAVLLQTQRLTSNGVKLRDIIVSEAENGKSKVTGIFYQTDDTYFSA